MARASHVDPRVLDHDENGTTIDLTHDRVRSPDRRQAELERAVLRLLASS
ncbi:MAG TPA: hypothetical protein VES95_07265 [Dermatophilaceae bacterium]|nr:hypothetical protein [Dermatophilaceae bacterium]